MEKFFKEWRGIKYAVRRILIEQSFGVGPEALVADYGLWCAIKDDFYDIHSDLHDDAVNLQHSIMLYLESDFINSDPTDEEILEHIYKLFRQMKSIKDEMQLT